MNNDKRDLELVSRSYHALKKTYVENNQYINVCLALMGSRREEIETRATELLSKYGHIKALKKAKQEGS